MTAPADQDTSAEFEFEAEQTDGPVLELGCRVVAIGGGHGLASVLKAARTYAGDIVGVVSVADDGGSSGRLRHELGLPAPGDLRRCLSALADGDSVLGQSLEHRFDRGALEGHPVGNLLIAGLASATGNFQGAIDEVARLIGASGRLVPATKGSVSLVADSDNGTLTGQVTIERAPGIRNLRFDTENPAVPDEALQAIAQADQVIIGPGSLYTSVLAVAVVPAIRDALAQTNAKMIYVANVANDKADSVGFHLPEHIQALTDHGIYPDAIIACPTVHHVQDLSAVAPEVLVKLAEVSADDGWGHDPVLLGRALRELAEL